MAGPKSKDKVAEGTILNVSCNWQCPERRGFKSSWYTISVGGKLVWK